MFAVEKHYSIESYIKAIAALCADFPRNRERILFPVLVSESEHIVDSWMQKRGLNVGPPNSHEAPIQGKEIRPQGLTHDTDNGVVVFLHDELELLAHLLAHATNRRAERASTIESAFEFHNDAKSVCFFCFTSDMTATRVELLANHASRRSVGVIAAQNVEELSFILLKTLHSRFEPSKVGAHLLVSRDDERECSSFPDGSMHFDSSTVHVSSLASALAYEYQVAALIGHGNGIDIIVNHDIALCALRKRYSWDTGIRHSCEHDSRHCVRRVKGITQLLPIDGVDSKLIFLGTCGGFPNGVCNFSEAILLRSSIVRGYATAYLSYTSVIVIHPATGILLLALLRSGMPIGSAVALLAELIPESPRVLLLLGDPDLCLYPVTRPSNLDISLRNVEGRWYLVIRGLLSFWHTSLFSNELLENIAIPPEAVRLQPGCLVNFKVAQHLKEFVHGIRVLFLQSGDGLRILVASPVSFAASYSEFTWVLNSENSLGQLICSIEQNFCMLGYLIGSVERRRATSASNYFLNSLKKGFSESKAILDLLRQISLDSNQERAQSILERVVANKIRLLQHDVLKDVARWGIVYAFKAYYQYEMLPEITQRSNPGQCPYCGAQTFKGISTSILRPDVQRWKTICSNCTIIFDAPMDIPLATLCCPSEVHIGVPFEVAIRLPVLKPRPLATSAALFLDGECQDWLKWTSQPSCVDLLPDEAVFCLEIEQNSTPGVYFIVAIVLVNCGFLVISRQLRVTATEPMRQRSPTILDFASTRDAD